MANLRKQVDMTDLIRAVAVLLRVVFGPRTRGRHCARPAVSAPCAAYPLPVQGPVRAPRRPSPRLLPRARSPYGLNTVLIGEEVALIRPYLVAYEERQQQRQRRRNLLFAAHLGIDLDTRLIHSVGVAR